MDTLQVNNDDAVRDVSRSRAIWAKLKQSAPDRAEVLLALRALRLS